MAAQPETRHYTFRWGRIVQWVVGLPAFVAIATVPEYGPMTTADHWQILAGLAGLAVAGAFGVLARVKASPDGLEHRRASGRRVQYRWEDIVAIDTGIVRGMMGGRRRAVAVTTRDGTAVERGLSARDGRSDETDELVRWLRAVARHFQDATEPAPAPPKQWRRQHEAPSDGPADRPADGPARRPAGRPSSRRGRRIRLSGPVLSAIGLVAVVLVTMAVHQLVSDHSEDQARGTTSSASLPPGRPSAPADARTVVVTKGAPELSCNHAPTCNYLHLHWEGFGRGTHLAVCRINGVDTPTVSNTVAGPSGDQDLACAVWPEVINLVYVTVDGVRSTTASW